MATQKQIVNFFEVSMIADALGVPVEFRPRDSYHVTGMIGHGTYDQPIGSWSDDSSLTLCLAETLTEGGGPTQLMQKFTAYLDGDYTPRGIRFDIGIGTSEAISRFNTGRVPATEAGSRSVNANGNGALMRIAPLAFALNGQNWPISRQRITDFTTVTHGHERAIIASCLYVETLRQLLAGQALADALKQADQLVQQSDFPAEELAYFDRLFSPDFFTASRGQIRSSGYVVDSLEAAVWCAANAASVQHLILTAANLGEDTDTIAQIAACLYAAGHLDEPAPMQWRQVLIRTPQSERIIREFAAKYGFR
ncbi:ADP-ribosylglycohydrolase family protein [Lacticaseibacillus jixianensis]|uniref:ADP-ribosylglycohydrolase family protein n=1 Tax=Lacticaseibacillus jixianensis TaxID=2486012 RepID=A0ABW4B5G4_9LACO|nr:ADP-ribosylglycohydrolase family protein [Lacticaseibacillus jixianensis]